MTASREYPPYISYLIATLMSVSMLAVQATLPFKLKDLGAGLDSVGFLFMWTSFWYVLAGLFLGWITHRVGPRRVMLVTLAICAVVTAGIALATSLRQIYALGTVYFVVICLFWAALEHASTGFHARLTLIQSTMIYGVAYTLGNAIGQMSSSLLQSQTVAMPFFVAASATVIVLGLTWFTISPQAGFRRSSPRDIAAFPTESRVRLRRSLLASRISVVGTYGTYAVVCLFLPRYLWEHRHFSKLLGGSLTTITILSMSATYAMLARWPGWPHRLWMLRVCPAVAAIGVAITGLTTSLPLIAVGAVITGIAAATAYAHNLYNSLEEPGTRARNAGIHEALVGAAFMIPPALAGLATRFTQMPESIFWVGATFGVTMGIVLNVVLALTAKRGNHLDTLSLIN